MSVFTDQSAAPFVMKDLNMNIVFDLNSISKRTKFETMKNIKEIKKGLDQEMGDKLSFSVSYDTFDDKQS